MKKTRVFSRPATILAVFSFPEREHLLDAVTYAVSEGEGDAVGFAGAAFLELQAAFEPEKLFKDEPEVGR